MGQHVRNVGNDANIGIISSLPVMALEVICGKGNEYRQYSAAACDACIIVEASKLLQSIIMAMAMRNRQRKQMAQPASS